MSKDEELAQRLLAEYRMLEGSIRVLESRLGIVNAALNDISLAYATLEGIKVQSEGSEALIPIGSTSFIKTSLKDINHIIMGVGADICVEKSMDDSLLELKTRQAELEKAKATLGENLGETAKQYELRRQKLNQMIEKQRGASPSVV